METSASENQAPPPLRRDIEAVPFEHEGKPMFLLKDPENISPRDMALSPAGLLIASLLDGRSTIEELRSSLTQNSGAVLAGAEISALVAQLAENKFLETPDVSSRRKEILGQFFASPKRKAAFQGPAYPANPLELAGLFGEHLRHPRGPGRPLPEKPSLQKPPLGLISPHIDFARGGPAYAWAYEALAQAPPPDLILALGVAHSSPNSPWVLTRKTYETPCGELAVSSELFESVSSCLWYDPLEDEWAHRREHSLEFQAAWLKFLWRDKTPAWLPVLCSSFERFCPDQPPSTVETVERALRSLGEKLARLSQNRRILVLAGVDLAHVGPRFGDDMQPTPELEKKIEREDRSSLEFACRLDAERFYLSVVADNHWRKVCGLSALYTALRCLKSLSSNDDVSGTLLAYGQAPDPMGGIVSFASAVFPAR